MIGTPGYQVWEHKLYLFSYAFLASGLITLLWPLIKKIPFISSRFDEPKTLFDKKIGDQSVSIWKIDLTGKKQRFSIASKLLGEGREGDAILLLLKGFKNNQTDQVLEVNLKESLKNSGYKLKGFDRWIASLNEAGYVLNSGFKRSKSYMITNPGMKKATEIQEDLTGLLQS